MNQHTIEQNEDTRTHTHTIEQNEDTRHRT